MQGNRLPNQHQEEKRKQARGKNMVCFILIKLKYVFNILFFMLKGSDDEDDGESSDSSKENETQRDENKASENSKLCELRKEYLLTKIDPYDNESTQVMQTYIDYDSAELVARYLASKRPFSQSFDTYLKHVRN